MFHVMYLFSTVSRVYKTTKTSNIFSISIFLICCMYYENNQYNYQYFLYDLCYLLKFPLQLQCVRPSGLNHIQPLLLQSSCAVLLYTCCCVQNRFSFLCSLHFSPPKATLTREGITLWDHCFAREHMFLCGR